MAEWKVLTTDEEIDEAIAAAQLEAELPVIVEAIYRPEPGLDLFIFTLSDGRRLTFPRENLQALKNATPEQAAAVAIGPGGNSVWWPQVDQGHRLENMLEGRTGSDAWMDRIHRRTAVAA